MVQDIAGHSLNTATSLNLSGTNQLFTDYVDPLYKTDFYKFPLSSPSNFNLTLNVISQDVNVELLNNSGAVIQGSYNTGILSETINQNLDIGNYYLRVDLNNNTTGSAYNLNLSAPVNPFVSISATDTTAGETLTGQTVNSGQFTVTRNVNLASPLTVNYTVAGTATNDIDYTNLPGTVTFAAGSATALINLVSVDDIFSEATETVTLNLATGTGYNLGTAKTATVNIFDNDIPVISISANDANAGETLTGQTVNPGQFTLTRAGNLASALTVNYAVAGTATNGTDYTTLPGNVTFAAGSAKALINLVSVDDTLSEATETVTLNLATGTGYNLGTTKTATVNIFDNDIPVISISATDANAGEKLTGQTANPGLFTLTRAGNLASALTVNYAVAGTATNGTDYTTLPGTVTFAAGSAKALINLVSVDDTLSEATETVILNLATGTGYNLGTTKTATVNIFDNDIPVINISATDANAGETLTGQTTNPGQFTLTRAGNVASTLTVNYTVAGTATNGTDYTKPLGTVTFAAGSATALINLVSVDDTLSEATETVTLNLATGTGYNLGTTKTATVNIFDNDIPVISISANDTNVGEKLTTETANPGQFTLTRIGNLASALTVNYTVAGTATNGTDYTSLPGSVTFAAGSANTFVDITPIDDSEFEGSETVVVNLATGSNYNIGTVNSATVTIAENDKPTVTVIANDNTAGETLATATANPGQFTLSRSGNTLAPLTINYTITGTAINGTDYSNLTGSVTFAAGYATTTINVTPIDDTASEGNESVVLTLVTGTNYNLGTGNTATTTIVDNDLPTITINANDGNAGETLTGQIANPGQFTLTRIGSTTSSLTVNYTVSGTAINGTDYNTLTNSVTFAAGSPTALININPINDTAFEGNETVIVTLATATNYVLGTAKTGTVTIADNDPAPFINVTSPNGGESLVIGSNYNLTWADSIAENVKIDLYKGGVYNRTILSSTLSDGSENWLLPADLVAGSDYSIKITSVNNGNVSDLSNSNFSIIPNHTGLINDINKDGKHDILWRNYGNGTQHFWSMNGATHVSDVDIQDNGDMAWHPVGLADFNNDGNMDILWRYYWVENTGHNVIWLMNGNNHVSDIVLDRVADNNYHVVGTGDFNLDGNADIVWRNYVSGENIIWLMNGTTHTSDIRPDIVTDLNQRIVGTGDFNGDGRSDILWRNAATGKLSLWFTNFVNQQLQITKTDVADIPGNGDLGWSVTGTGDMNNDGKSDIILRYLPTGGNHVWLMNGATRIGDLDIDDVSDRTWNIVGDSDPVPVWTTNYFGNKDLSGTPTYTEGFTDIIGNFSRDWGNGSVPNTPTDNFSARYQTTRYFAPGLYHITTAADDGINVRIGNEYVVNKYNQIGLSSGYFRSTGGYYPVTVEYKEDYGAASINFKLEGHQAFNDNVDTSKYWNGSIYHWDGQGTAPSFDIFRDQGNLIGNANLGSNVRSDGKIGINANWGQDAPNGDNARLPHDFFMMGAWTLQYFDGSEYKFRVRGDDGFHLSANGAWGQGGNYDITPANQWLYAYGDYYEVNYTLPAGWYDVGYQMWEGGGAAYIDMSWEKTVVAPPPPVWEKPLGSYWVSQEFTGSTFYTNHTGIDLAANSGTRVEAAKNGTVIRASWDTSGYGNLVVIDHGDGLKTYYAHLNTIDVGVGQYVDINTQIGTVGSTGNSTGPHLHFETRLNGVPQNPKNYISL